MARILITDDEPDMRVLLQHILEDEGHETFQATDGEEALTLVASVHPDLLVLDLMMPKADGFTVLETMIAAGFIEQVKVLIVTAKSSESDFARGYELGADLYLTKPFDPDELVAAVEKMLATSKDELREMREHERDKADMLSQLESMFQTP